MSKSEKQDVSPEVANEFVERLHTTSTKREPLKKRLSTPKTTDLGTQVVGSQHTYLVPLPQNIDPSAGDAKGSTLFEESYVMKPAHDFGSAIELKFGEPAKQFEVDYSPVGRGDYSADLHFVGRWADGHVEDAVVPVHAAARELTDIRTTPDAPPVHDIGSKLSAPLSKEQSAKAETLGFNKAISQLDRTVGYLFRSQLEGVNVVEKEQSTFGALPPEKPLWADLVQIAIEMGFAVVSERLGEIVGKGIVSVLGEEFEHKHKAVIKGFEKGVEGGLESAVEVSKISEVEPAEPKEKKEASREGEGTTDEVGDTFDETAQQQVSSNTSIAFFQAQRDLLSNSEAAARNAVSNGLVKLAADLGQDAPAVGNALAAAETKVEKADPYVLKSQSSLTTAQWMTYLARRELGSVTAPSVNGPVTSTMMVDARMAKGFLEPRSADGLLSLNLRWDGSHLQIESARVTGIAQATANRLLHMNLKTSRLPLVVRVGLATITIDEAARVRSDGGPVNLASHADGIPWNEVQDARDVQEVVDALYSMSLARHGLTEITTNDANKKK